MTERPSPSPSILRCRRRRSEPLDDKYMLLLLPSEEAWRGRPMMTVQGPGTTTAMLYILGLD